MRTVLFLIVLVAFLTSTAAFFRNPKERHHDQMEREGTGVQKPHIWGHLEGRTFEEARDEIKRDRPEAVIHRVPMNAAVTMDYREDRVRIFVDEDGKVTRKPMIG